MIQPTQSLSKRQSISDGYSWPLILFYFAMVLNSTYLNKSTIMVAIIILMILNYKKSFLNISQLTKVSSIIILHLIGILSYFWSFVPSQTLIYVLNDLQLLAMAFLLAQYSKEKNIVKSLKFSSKIIILSAFCYSVLFYGDSMTAIGLKSFFDHKNGLGAVMALNLLILISCQDFTRKDFIFLTMGFTLMILSESKTSIGLFFAIIFISLLIMALMRIFNNFSNYTQGFLKLFSRLIPIILYLLIILIVVFREEVSCYLIQIIPKELFTGRGLLWLTVLTRTKDDLLLGIGTGAFWGSGGAERMSEIAQTPLYIEEWIQRLKAGDGGYIDIIGSHGFLGLAFLIVALIQVYTLIIHHASHIAAWPAFVAVTFFVFHNITETDIFRFKDIFWFFFLFIMFYLVMLPKDKKHKPI